jgi:hypothetical protein
MSKPLDDNSVRAKALEWGISRMAAHRVLVSGRSIEGKAVLIEQAKRASQNRRLHRQDGDYRKRKEA